HPGVLRWAPLYIVLTAGSMLGAWMRREHSLWANACAVLASSAMPLVMQPYGAHATYAVQLAGDTLPSVHNWFPAGTFAQPALTLSLAYAAMLGGSVLFVKTMIRERGNRAYLAASWIWHIAICAVGFAVSPWLGAAGALLLLRAIGLPLIARVRRVPAKYTGITECVASTLCFVLITCAAI
ncbi:YwiC-like family protein, partial [Bifidobacterium sp.]